jgi:hypothetical protein
MAEIVAPPCVVSTKRLIAVACRSGKYRLGLGASGTVVRAFAGGSSSPLIADNNGATPVTA